MKRIAIILFVAALTVSCHHRDDGPGGTPMSLDICTDIDVVLGCAGNTWPVCASSCPPLNFDWDELVAECNEPSAPGRGTQCNCLTGECHPCTWGVDCHCDAPGTACNPT